MKKMMLIALLILFACSGFLSAAPGSFHPNWIPAQSKWLIHFDQATFSQTKLFSIIDRHWQDDEHSIQSEILDELNIDISKDLIGLTVIGLDRIAKGDKIVVILQGKFDKDYMVKRIKNKEKKAVEKVIAGLKVLCWDGDNHIFFPEKDVIVFCETDSGIEEIMNLWQGKARAISASSPLLRILDEAPHNAFVRAAVTDVSALTQFAPKTMVLDSASVAFFMALEAKDNLSMMLKLVTESEKKAQNLQQIITGLRALVSLKAFDEDEDVSQFADLLNGLEISTEGKRLVMNFDYPVEKIGKLINGMKHKKRKVIREDEED